MTRAAPHRPRPDPAHPGVVAVVPVPFTSPDAVRLLAAAEAELLARYGPGPHDVDASDDADHLHRPLRTDDFTPPRGTFLVARLDGAGAAAVGCVGLRPLDDGAGEVKRLFVETAQRGRGLARLLMDALERAAWDLGYRHLRLETGGRQPEAIELYRTSGWTSTGSYLGALRHESSVYFEKPLAEPGA